VRVFCLLKALIISFFCFATLAQSNANLQNEKLQQLLKQIQIFKDDLNQHEGQYKNEYATLQQVETKLGEITIKVSSLKKEINANKRELNKLYSQLNSYSQTIDDLEDKIKKDVETAYLIGQQEHLKLILMQENASDLARIIEYYSFILTARTTRIKEYLDLVKKLDETTRDIEIKNIDQLKLLDKLEEQRKEAKANFNIRSQIVKNLLQQINTTQKKIDEFQIMSKQLEQLIVQINDVDKSINNNEFTNIKYMRGKLQYPVFESRLVNLYGKKRVGNLKWNGVKFDAPFNSPIQPIFPGRVVMTGYLRGYGLIVIIDHGFDYLTLYAQNNAILVAEGDWVDMTTRIATVGYTGGQNKPGLYFELRHKGEVLNPEKWF